MKTVIFVCHGNICRSCAAEFIAKDYLKKINRLYDFNIISRAVSLEEIGNDIYPPMKRELIRQRIPFSLHHATLITQKDYDNADYVFIMDDSNARRINYYINNNRNILYPIYMYSNGIYEIEDPWYTERFNKVVEQLKTCIKDIFDNI